MKKKKKESAEKNAEFFAKQKKVNKFEQKPVEIDENFNTEEEEVKKSASAVENFFKVKTAVREHLRLLLRQKNF